MAANWLQANPNASGFTKSIWEAYSKFRYLPLKSTIKNEAIWGLTSPVAFTKQYNKDKWTMALNDARASDATMTAYLKPRTGRKGGKRTRVVTMSTGEL